MFPPDWDRPRPCHCEERSVIARDLQRAGAGVRSLAKPVLDATGDFAKPVFAVLGVAARLECRRIMERTARGRTGAKANGGELRSQADLCSAS
jgi:DNA invertase Pin-like site-specific DNA recombinase